MIKKSFKGRAAIHLNYIAFAPVCLQYAKIVPKIQDDLKNQHKSLQKFKITA